MKKYLLFLLFLSAACAKPLIDTSIHPQELWLGDEATIHFNCSDGNYSIKKFEVLFTNPVMIPNSSLSIQKSSDYYFSLRLVYPYYGRYTYQIYCESDNAEENSTSADFEFFVYNLSASIESIKPGKIYEGDEIKAFVKVRKNEIEMNASSDLSFKIFLDNSQIQPSTPIYYDSSKGWVLSFFSPIGKHKLKIESSLNQKSVLVERDIEVHKSIELSFLGIDKTEVNPEDYATLRFFAKERDYKIDNSSLSISLLLDNSNLPFNYSLLDSLDGTTIEIKTKMANISVGDHTISASLGYKNQTLSKDVQIIRPLRIEGGFINDDGLGYSGKIKFKRGSFERSFMANTSGYFSGFIPKGEYDVEMEIKDYPNYPGVKLILKDANINSFEDPIRFDVLKDVNIDGLGLGAVYLIRTDLEFSKATLELAYDQKKIANESEIIVYKCEDWNFAKRQCNVELEEIDATVDKDKNIVRFDSSSFSVFIISYRKKLLLNLMTDKKNYNLNEMVTISGYVQDDDGNYISDAEVKIKIFGGGSYSTKTDKNGYFLVQALSPQNEGIFKIEARASKSEFIQDIKALEINVTKSRKLVLFLDDSYKLYEGENITLPLKIINTGQADISLAKINITGLPENFKLITNREQRDIKVGEERESQIQIFAPENSSSSIMLKIYLNYDNAVSEKQILLIVEKKPAQNSIPTAKIVLPNFDKEIIYSISASFAIILVAYVLKKNKPKRNDDRMLKEIKNEINKEKPI
jgi:hypothetical protein